MSYKIISKVLGALLFLVAAIVNAVLSEDSFISSIITLGLAFFSGTILSVANTVISDKRFITGAVIVSLVVNVLLFAGCYILWQKWQQSCVMVPDLTGKTVTEAIDELNSCGLAYNDNDDADAVIISQNPRGNIEVAPGTVVKLSFEDKEVSEGSNLIDIPEPTASLSVDFLDARPGKTFTFGRYEQDEEVEGAEPIEWVILEVKSDRVLVVSKLGLEALPYNKSGDRTTWEHSSIRTWLKDDFYYTAFSEDEQAQILQTNNLADDDKDAQRKQGNDTIDYVFLLSITEANKYIINNSSLEDDEHCCKPSPYAYDNVEVISDGKYCWWWLRTVAEDSKKACSINSDGTLNYGTREVSWKQGAVRPAMWLSLD